MEEEEEEEAEAQAYRNWPKLTETSPSLHYKHVSIAVFGSSRFASRLPVATPMMLGTMDMTIGPTTPDSHRSDNSSCACSRCCCRGRFSVEDDDYSCASWDSDDPDDPWEQSEGQGCDGDDPYEAQREEARQDMAQDEAQREEARQDMARLRRAIVLERARQHPAAADHLQPRPEGSPAAAVAPESPDEQPATLRLQAAAAAAAAARRLHGIQVPPHAHWLASIPDLWQTGWYRDVFAPEGPPEEWFSTACRWHHPTYCNDNTGELRLVVGQYNTINNQAELHGVLNSFEVGAFRTDRGVWYPLVEQIGRAFQLRHLTVQRGRAPVRHSLFTCIRCGNFIFVDQTGIGQSPIATPEDEAVRRHICTFFNWSMRAPDAAVRR